MVANKEPRRPAPRIPGASVYRRFMAKVSQPDGCWEWTAMTYPYGYGALKIGRNNYAAHRVSWEMHYGPIPEGLLVCHHCDNPACVRPDHLFLGTDQDNRTDCKNKGRVGNNPRVGEEHYHHILTEDQVRELRARRKAGETNRAVAERFGVSMNQVSKIANRRSWKHIPDEL